MFHVSSPLIIKTMPHYVQYLRPRRGVVCRPSIVSLSFHPFFDSFRGGTQFWMDLQRSQRATPAALAFQIHPPALVCIQGPGVPGEEETDPTGAHQSQHADTPIPPTSELKSGRYCGGPADRQKDKAGDFFFFRSMQQTDFPVRASALSTDSGLPLHTPLRYVVVRPGFWAALRHQSVKRMFNFGNRRPAL